jgi:cytochrome c
MRRSGLLLVFAVFAMAATRSIWEGVYTKAQATRGQSAYREECAKCHSENLGGGEGAPALVGDEFLTKWKGKTAGDLFERIQKSMPSDDPGSLSRRKCADITAYMLSANEYPAGEKELESTPETLNQIRLEAKR